MIVSLGNVEIVELAIVIMKLLRAQSSTCFGAVLPSRGLHHQQYMLSGSCYATIVKLEWQYSKHYLAVNEVTNCSRVFVLHFTTLEFPENEVSLLILISHAHCISSIDGFRLLAESTRPDY